MKRKSAKVFVVLMLSLVFSGAHGSVEMRQVVFQNEYLSYNFAISCINITSCLPWSVCEVSQDVCKCIKLSEYFLICNESIPNELTPYILDYDCITFNKDKERIMLEVGKCYYNIAEYYDNLYSIYQQLPDNMSDWNNFMCKKFHRTGSLFGKCDTDRDYYPRVYSFDMSCMKCGNNSSNWWKYILLA